MARVRNEVDTHLFGRASLAAINQPHEKVTLAKRRNPNQPVTPRPTEPGSLYLFGAFNLPTRKALYQHGMRQYLAYINAFDSHAQQVPSGGIAHGHGSTAHDNRSLREALDQFSALVSL